MTIFYICRHGETENNKKGRFSGWVDTPLTKEGVQNVASSATKLKGITFDKIVSSDLGRAFTTAYLISRELGYMSAIDRLRDFREVNYGDLANMPYGAYPELSAFENASYIPPNGESLAQMQSRALACLSALAQANEGKTVLIVAHDGTINSVRASLVGENIGAADATQNAHDFVAKFEYDDGKVVSFDEVVV
jgi:broad specificity phosphatase PhoE